MIQDQNLTQELNRIVAVLKQKYTPDKIIVYGSYAQKRLTDGSDLDIVVIKDTSQRFYERIKELVQLTNPQEAVDFLVYTPEEFADMQKYSYFVRDEVLKKGSVVYDKNH